MCVLHFPKNIKFILKCFQLCFHFFLELFTIPKLILKKITSLPFQSRSHLKFIFNSFFFMKLTITGNIYLNMLKLHSLTSRFSSKWTREISIKLFLCKTVLQKKQVTAFLYITYWMYVSRWLDRRKYNYYLIF